MTWFKRLFGFEEMSLSCDEEMWNLNRSRFYVYDKTIAGPNGKRYSIGDFEVPSVGELRDMHEKTRKKMAHIFHPIDKNVETTGLGLTAVCQCGVHMSKHLQEGCTNFRVARLKSGLYGNIWQQRQYLTIDFLLQDVGELQANPENNYATFQVASQFNCLEHATPEITLAKGIGIYINDKTQGPACCISAGPATAFRNYFAQTPSREINTLADFIEYLNVTEELKVENGYAGHLVNATQLSCINHKLPKRKGGLDEARKYLRVGVHYDVEVTSSNWGKTPCEKTTVTQVFCSALAVKYNKACPRPEFKDIATLILTSAYEATLLAAAENMINHGGTEASRIVYLTLLGNGAFGNDARWIADAIKYATDKYWYLPLKVIIVDVEILPREVSELCTNRKRSHD